jgi:hypothetical protein
MKVAILLVTAIAFLASGSGMAGEKPEENFNERNYVEDIPSETIDGIPVDIGKEIIILQKPRSIDILGSICTDEVSLIGRRRICFTPQALTLISGLSAASTLAISKTAFSILEQQYALKVSDVRNKLLVYSGSERYSQRMARPILNKLQSKTSRGALRATGYIGAATSIVQVISNLFEVQGSEAYETDNVIIPELNKRLHKELNRGIDEVDAALIIKGLYRRSLTDMRGDNDMLSDDKFREKYKDNFINKDITVLFTTKNERIIREEEMNRLMKSIDLDALERKFSESMLRNEQINSFLNTEKCSENFEPALCSEPRPLTPPPQEIGESPP